MTRDEQEAGCAFILIAVVFGLALLLALWAINSGALGTPALDSAPP